MCTFEGCVSSRKSLRILPEQNLTVVNDWNELKDTYSEHDFGNLLETDELRSSLDGKDGWESEWVSNAEFVTQMATKWFRRHTLGSVA